MSTKKYKLYGGGYSCKYDEKNSLKCTYDNKSFICPEYTNEDLKDYSFMKCKRDEENKKKLLCEEPIGSYTGKVDNICNIEEDVVNIDYGMKSPYLTITIKKIN